MTRRYEIAFDEVVEVARLVAEAENDLRMWESVGVLRMRLRSLDTGTPGEEGT